MEKKNGEWNEHVVVYKNIMQISSLKHWMPTIVSTTTCIGLVGLVCGVNATFNNISVISW
jgi:hypothetical protein